MKPILVTGATGFVGRHLCDTLTSIGCRVIGTTRSRISRSASSNCELRAICDIGDDVDWGPILEGVEDVVHLAARVHVMREAEEDPLAAFRRVNVRGTEQLLRHKAMRGVRRFVYLSSVKVHGEETKNTPFSASDGFMPCDPYAQSKLEAERLVETLGLEQGIETVIIRPPLVYGPGVGGNFIRLLSMVEKGVPLPFGLIRNARSLVSVQNLCSLVLESLTNSAAASKQFLVSDNNDLSTPGLIRLMASSMGCSAKLVPLPLATLTLLGKVIGQSSAMSRLTGSLQVSIDETMRTLDWQPPFSVADGVQSAVTWYLKHKSDG